MSRTLPPTGIRLPDDLQTQLGEYRRQVWMSKVAEAVAVASCSVLLVWFVVFLLDRLFDTPAWLRGAALVLIVAGVALVPLAIYRWIWRRRTLHQVARLLFLRLPGPGDRLLGVLDLVSDASEQSRSPVLCRAAVEQVAAEARKWDLSVGLPTSRNRLWWVQAVLLASLMGLIEIVAPAAVHNAWVRLTSPWTDTPRYTFAELRDVPPQQVVAHGEPFSFVVSLSDASRWHPANGTLMIGEQTPIAAKLEDNQYHFNVPPQIDASKLQLRVGDARQSVLLKPMLRPELESVAAEVTLPAYLQREGQIEHDARGGSLALVHGSLARVRARANRELEMATINGQQRMPHGATFESAETNVSDSTELELQWRDSVGLEGKQPFTVSIVAHEDGSPTISCSGIRRQQIVLVSEQLSFQFQAQDDFGIQKVGMQWQGFQYNGQPSDTKGSQVLAAGSPQRETLNGLGTFQADALGITPQPIELRLFATDYRPGREPILSPPFLLYVLSADEHAIWLTEQLSKWHRQSLEVRDRELSLHAKNKSLRQLSPKELDNPEMRRVIEQQAAAEMANGRRLGSLTQMGEQILQQATRNPEFGVGHLEKWAEMLQILKDIAGNRMPSVSDLLKDASDAPRLASRSAAASRTIGVDRSKGVGPSEAGDKEESSSTKTQPAVPQIVDQESSEQPQEDDSRLASGEKKGGAGVLRLPVTTLTGKSKSSDACPTEQLMEEAVVEQEDLLAEFEKVANELNNILANLEGSTLVKRLKAESRKQVAISTSIADLLESSFGAEKPSDDFAPITDLEKQSSMNVSYIMDDMQAYFDRRPFAQFKRVLEEMREADVLGSLRKLQTDIPDESGLSMAQCDFWSDTMDRWAEDLVDPASGGT